MISLYIVVFVLIFLLNARYFHVRGEHHNAMMSEITIAGLLLYGYFSEYVDKLGGFLFPVGILGWACLYMVYNKNYKVATIFGVLGVALAGFSVVKF